MSLSIDYRRAAVGAVSALSVAGVLLFAPVAHAAPGDTSGKPAAKNDPQAIASARAHYERGLRLYEDGSFDAARVEFQRAYEIAPTYRILYNLGLVRQMQNEFVDALASLERYLEEGGAQVPEARRVEVQRLVTELRSRVGRLKVNVNPPGATVAIDDVVVPYDGTPIVLNPGRRRVTVSKAEKTTQTKVIDIVGSETATIDFQLTDNRVVIVMDSSRRIPWGWWIATGVLAAGATGTGLWALGTRNDLRELKERESTPDPDRLDSFSTRATVLGITTDALIVTAAAAGVVATYLTIKWGKEPGAARPAGSTALVRSTSVVPTPTSLSLTGTF